MSAFSCQVMTTQCSHTTSEMTVVDLWWTAPPPPLLLSDELVEGAWLQLIFLIWKYILLHAMYVLVSLPVCLFCCAPWEV